LEEEDVAYSSNSSDSEISNYLDSEEGDVIAKNNQKIRGNLLTNATKNKVNKKNPDRPKVLYLFYFNCSDNSKKLIKIIFRNLKETMGNNV
jgi:hypothetical protein